MHDDEILKAIAVGDISIDRILEISSQYVGENIEKISMFLDNMVKFGQISVKKNSTIKNKLGISVNKKSTVSTINSDLKVTKTFKFRLYPTPNEIKHLDRQITLSRKLFNEALEWILFDKIRHQTDKESWAVDRKDNLYGEIKISDRWYAPNGQSLKNLSTNIRKRANGAYSDASSASINCVLDINLYKAISGVKSSDIVIHENGQWYVERMTYARDANKKYILDDEGKKTLIPYKFKISKAKGFPCFKSAKDLSSMYVYDQSRNSIRIDGKNGFIRIPKLQTLVKFYCHREMVGGEYATTYTITKDALGNWWISIPYSYEVANINYPIDINSTVGIDFGIGKSAVTSNGITLDNDKNYQKYNKLHKKLNKKISNKYEAKKKYLELTRNSTICPICKHDSIDNIVINGSHKHFQCSECNFTPKNKSKKLLKFERRLAKLAIRSTNIRNNRINNFTADIANNDDIYTIIMKESRISNFRQSEGEYKSKKDRAINRSLASSSIGIIKQSLINKMAIRRKNVLIVNDSYKSYTICPECGANIPFNYRLLEVTCICGAVFTSRKELAADNVRQLVINNDANMISGAICGSIALDTYGKHSTKVTKNVGAITSE